MSVSSQIIYLDNAAAMPVSPAMAAKFADYAVRFYANPESGHRLGRITRKAISEAREKILQTLSVPDGFELCFLGSATEAIVLATSFPGFSGRSCVTTDGEHSALDAALRRNCEIRRVRLANNGMIEIENLSSQLDTGVDLLAVHHVQSEIGIIQDLPKIKKMLSQQSPEAVMMVDTVQSVGKLKLPWQDAGIDIAFVGGHKVGAPSGGALIYNKSRLRDFGDWLTRQRQTEHCIGRPDPAVAMTLADAISEAMDKREQKLQNVSNLSCQLRDGVAKLELRPDTEIKSMPIEKSSPYIISLRLPPYQGAVLVRMLAKQGIMISAGTACEAEHDTPSRVLSAIGCSKQEAYAGIRISLRDDNSPDEIKSFIKALQLSMREY